MYAKVFKRLLDIIFSIILMPLFLILFVIVGIAIKLEDGGPIFYYGERLGRHGKPFKMYKFRSMKANAPDWRLEDGSTYNAEDDPRQTRIGKVLRKTSIDEIPQLLNVLKGEMSFIGPRPDLPEHINCYNTNEMKKLEVLPGISGYNQAYYRNFASWKQRLENDVYYVENISFVLDVRIFFKTIERIALKRDVYLDFKSNSLEVVNSNVQHKKS